MGQPLIQVLLIEDNPADALLLREALDRPGPAGFGVVVAERLSEGLGQLRTHPFDAVLLDLGLPDSQGLTTFIRVHAQAPETPVVVLSGLADEQVALEAVQAGAQDYLVKGPASWETLSRVIRYSIERQQARDALDASERRFRALIEHNTDAIALLSAEGVIRYESPAANRISGFEPGEMIGRNLLGATQPDDRAAVAGQLQQVRQQPGDVVAFQARFLRKNGAVRWLEATLTNLLDEPSVQAVVLNFRDVTRRREAEDGVRASETRFRALFENAPVALWEEDYAGVKTRLDQARAQDGVTDWPAYLEAHPAVVAECAARVKVLDVNRAAQAMHGAADKDELRRSLTNVFSPESYTAFARQLAAVAEGQLVYTGDNMNANLAGQARYVNVGWSVVPGHEATLGRVIVSVQDLTARKQAEAALQASEEKFRSLIEQSSEGMVLLDEQGTVVEWNQAETRITGIAREQALGAAFADIQYQLLPPERRAGRGPEYFQQALGGMLRTGELPRLSSEHGVRIQTARGETKIISQTAFPIKTESGYRLGALVEDITERQQAEAALRASEERYRTIFQTAAVSIWEEDFSGLQAALDALRAQGVTDFERYLDEHPEFAAQAAHLVIVRDVNDTTLKLFGAHDKDELRGPLDRLLAPENGTVFREQLLAIAAGETHFEGEVTNRTRDGRQIQMWLTMTIPAEKEQLRSLLVSVMDISARKRAEQQLRDDEARLSVIFHRSPLGIVTTRLADGLILDANAAFAELHGYTPDELRGHTGAELGLWARPAEREAVMRQTRETGSCRDVVIQGRQKSGALRDLRVSVELVELAGEACTLGLAEDVTERKRAEEKLHESEARYRMIYEASPMGIVNLDGQGQVLHTNPAFQHLLGYSQAELEQMTVGDFTDLDDQAVSWEAQAALAEGQQDRLPLEKRYRRKDGSRLWANATISAVRDAEGQLLSTVAVVEDITPRRQAEAALRASETQFREMAEQLVDVLFVTNREGINTYISPAAKRMFGWKAAEMTGQSFAQFLPEGDGARAMEKFRATMQFGTPAQHLELTMGRKDGSTFEGELSASPLLREGQVAGAIGLIRDVTERKQADRRIRAQLERLAALQTIDDTIIGSFDMRLALDEVLKQTATQLHADAACVLLLNHPLQRLTYAAGRGFRTEALRQTNLRLGEGHAGQAALERRAVVIPDLGARLSDFQTAPRFAAEQFVSYCAVPLMAKGQVEGVLEAFQRSPLEPDEEWLSFLETLAKQAAIAIDNAQLFSGLQRANADLFRAYEDTIEGWSRALDLRDRETEGHTQRVTEMTLRLARAMGLPEAEIVHIRRGALLHDIGKMGVPDSILLKPGSLTAEEWDNMRAHPGQAYEMLAPIAYLRPALDIPYAHHERWDGAGYPRGLKGEAIPLAARLFAVVDVWDALRSDRPYRPRWAEGRVLEYLRAGAGTHFDPQVVELFLRVLREGEQPGC